MTISQTENLRSALSHKFPWGTERRFNAYGDYIKKRFGSRVQKVSVDAGFTCPNRDGSKGVGGCTYCNNTSFVPPYCRPGMSISQQVAAGISYLSRRYGAHKFIVYFQAYSNTYAPLSALKSLYEEALSHPAVLGLAIGTRPDCVDEEKIAYLAGLARKWYISIEYGLESAHNSTLEKLNRGHNFEDWARALSQTAGRGLEVCSHVILGLPGESREDMLQTAARISQYPLDSLKIHHLHLVRKTVLATQYLKNPFPLLGFREYVDLVVEFLQILNPRIRIQRMVGETHPRHLIGPIWGLRADTVQRYIETELERRNVWQGIQYIPPAEKE